MAKIEFRDGPKEVPDHIAEMIAVFDTYKMTYDEAMRKANNRMAADYLNKAQQSVISAHFKRPL